MGFSTFGFTDQIMQGVRAAGYTAPTPIQSLAIMPAMAGKDLVASAQTGTGKTAAFVLPMLHRLAATPVGRGASPRALVLTPTRELAHQVQDAVSTYGRYLPLRAVSIYGGVGMEGQVSLLRRGADIVVATPGRLLDHLQRRTIDLSNVRILVLDEADRMLDMGFIRDVRRVIDGLPKQRQTLLFSATLSPEIITFAGDILRDPQTLEAGERRNPADTVTQHFYESPREAKMDLLLHVIGTEAMASVLVFARTKHGADKICRKLERSGIASVAIHSNRTQPQRERALEGFRRGTFRVLVATDIAARGIDVSGISHVINYDVPQFAEDYIHRIGRTGRAGASGEAITFVSGEERQYLRRLEQFTGKRYMPKRYPGAPEPAAPAMVSNASRPQFPHHTPRGAGERGSRRSTPVPVRKRKPAKKLESYSSDPGSTRWSNY